MRLGKWILVIAAMAMICTAASAQIQANKLCIHNGSEYYTNGPFHGFPNEGGFKYFPSYAHCPAQPVGGVGGQYSWKIAGWAWSGMQANTFTTVWYWETAMQKSTDFANSPGMSFDYPQIVCLGIVPHTGFPMPIYGGTIPTSVPAIGGQCMVFPSSTGGFDAYLNIFAYGAGSWVIPSTLPYYGWQFAFTFGGCPSYVTLPENNSVVIQAWAMRGAFEVGTADHYLLLSGNEIDCIGGGGNKGRSYTVISDCDNGYLWYWTNGCTGSTVEWAMCLWLCDIVSIPYNVPGAPNPANPYAAYGFDVGSATLTPYLSSGCVCLGFVTEDFNGAGNSYAPLCALTSTSGSTIYSKKAWRLCFGYDPVMWPIFISLIPFYTHQVQPGYPACCFGTTVGGHSNCIPFPPEPGLQCLTFDFACLNVNTGKAPSATYTVVWF